MTTETMTNEEYYHRRDAALDLLKAAKEAERSAHEAQVTAEKAAHDLFTRGFLQIKWRFSHSIWNGGKDLQFNSDHREPLQATPWCDRAVFEAVGVPSWATHVSGRSLTVRLDQAPEEIRSHLMDEIVRIRVDITERLRAARKEKAEAERKVVYLAEAIQRLSRPEDDRAFMVAELGPDLLVKADAWAAEHRCPAPRIVLGVIDKKRYVTCAECLAHHEVV